MKIMEHILTKIKEYNEKYTIKLISDKNLYNKILMPLQKNNNFLNRLKNIRYNYSMNWYKYRLKRDLVRFFYNNRGDVNLSNESN